MFHMSRLDPDGLSWVSPADGPVDGAHEQQGDGEVPGEAHGDEHHVVVVLQVPRRAAGGVQHEPDLQPERSKKVLCSRGDAHQRATGHAHQWATGHAHQWVTGHAH